MTPDFKDLQKIEPLDEPPQPETPATRSTMAPELGGRKGPEPTRYGDWENRGRCIDF